MSESPSAAQDSVEPLIDPELRAEIGDPLSIPFTAWVVYLPLLVAGALLAWCWQESLPGPLDAHSLMQAALIGLGAGLIFVAFTWLLSRCWAPMRMLESEFRSALGPLSVAQIVQIALLSGLSEEVFFRGVLQPWIGLWAATLIFGAVHFVPHRAYRPWAFFALVAGVGFGFLLEWTGSLLAPIVAHITVNGLNLLVIVRGKPQPAQGD